MTVEHPFIIGIDLGTTNCTMAYAKTGEEQTDVRQFLIPQIVAAGTQADEASLPSFIYFPPPEELKNKTAGIDWDTDRSYCIGKFAMERGAEIPGRLVASAKSWLCHAGIDRREKLLPLDDADECESVSPLEACARILAHMKEAWNQKMPDAPFVKQHVLITVPASFDPSARQLVLEAAELAGYPAFVLLEEPQAAFYAWLEAHASEWRKELQVGDSVLVVDIGGGTTDFSLIGVSENQGSLDLQRVAVGSHLLLGGDNLDLALAYLAKNKLEEEGHNIDDRQLQALVHACRKAKEKLLGAKPPKTCELTVMGRGSRLIGGALKTSISLQEANSLILDGFIPLVNHKERSPSEKRLGIQQVGLPYAQDARISGQLAKFLSMSGESEKADDTAFVMPTAVLFNGGTLKAAALRDRLIEQLNQWAQERNSPPIKVLPGADYDYGVSRGAVYYGAARLGKGIRIRSGTSRSYYIGVEDAAPAVPGMPASLKAVCVVPFGMEEGTEQSLLRQEFALVLGELATFRFFSRSTGTLSDGVEPAIGTAVRKWKGELEELHPIETRLEKEEGDGKTIRVKLKSKVTELGVLELWCEAEAGRRWKLEFDLRKE